MDFVDGEVLELLEDPESVVKVLGISEHLACRNVPGPFAGSPPCGLLFFPDEGEVSFADVKEPEQWWKRRLLPGEPAVRFQGLGLVLCHLDVAPRNILRREGEAPCLIDWASTGYHPRLFEFRVMYS